jgi:hypothetical protein
MSTLHVFTHAKAKRASTKAGKVVTKRLRTDAGDFVTVHAIDADSSTFGDDFLYVFKQNVRKAREHNLELFGSPDRVSKAS